MQTRITFRVSGINLRAQECLAALNSNELIAAFDEEFPNHLSFIHPLEFSEYWDEVYEKAFLDFIVKNINVLQKYGADEYALFTEMYIQNDEQCNFEVLSEGFYPYIWKYNIALPVSVYIDDDITQEESA